MIYVWAFILGCTLFVVLNAIYVYHTLLELIVYLEFGL